MLTMYQLKDTIVAVSSPTADKRVIVRISGPETIDVVKKIFSPLQIKDKAHLLNGTLIIDDELKIDAKVYLFIAPHSYTGETLAEIHFDANANIADKLMASLLSKSLRLAEPGEFTARAYLNGKIDLAQAEAINEIIISGNNFQLEAGQKLLAGRLTDTINAVRDEIMECLGLIEAGLDFSGEDIEFISRQEAIARLSAMGEKLKSLLDGSISYETVIGLPSVGIAGAPNAGKSSLLNILLGRERSIVSEQPKTTRDILSGQMTLPHSRCVLFDCAGLIEKPETILDKLAQQTAIEALKNCSLVIFCIDVSKADWTQDCAIFKFIETKNLIMAATKFDLPDAKTLSIKSDELNKLFGTTFIQTSSKTSSGLNLLMSQIDEHLLELVGKISFDTVGLTARHKQSITEAINNINDALDQIENENNEIAAMMLRTAYQSLSQISRQTIDEQILENIFHKFCIGK